MVLLLVPDVLDQGIQADATAYFGNISAAAPFGTEVFRFRLVIDLSHFHDDLDVIAIFVNENNLVESIFRLSDGQNFRVFLIADQGGIDRVNASRVYPEIRLIENRLVVYEDSVIYQEIPPASLELPTVLDIELHFIAVGRSYIDIQQLSPFAIGRVALTPLSPGRIYYLFIVIILLCPHITHIIMYHAVDHPCFEYPCENGGSCGTNASPTQQKQMGYINPKFGVILPATQVTHFLGNFYHNISWLNYLLIKLVNVTQNWD